MAGWQSNGSKQVRIYRVDNRSIASHRRAKTTKKNSSSEPSLFTPTWKVAIDGFCALAFLAILFSVSAWMLCHLTLDLATFGDAEVLNFWQRF